MSVGLAINIAIGAINYFFISIKNNHLAYWPVKAIFKPVQSKPLSSDAPKTERHVSALFREDVSDLKDLNASIAGC
ncbi:MULTISPECIES: hypothetical protein [unclassified Methylophilus]|uniref:hypothetical protein n=1 Tax=unclassified Methylophilus TaxID=2630143 RepID=UPI00036FF6D2|nr:MULTISPECIES: hypothetical protein [unclassified Methylophilus]